MSEENRSTHKLYEKEKIGEVQIADEVVAIIAGLAATEVEGVDSMAGNITNELAVSYTHLMMEQEETDAYWEEQFKKRGREIVGYLRFSKSDLVSDRLAGIIEETLNQKETRCV